MRAFIAAAFAAVAVAQKMRPADYDYMRYVAQYGKNYDTMEEFKSRQAQFESANEYIAEHNQTNSSHVAGHNQFSDWTATEIQSMLGTKEGLYVEPQHAEAFTGTTEANGIDWREHEGVLTPVKDQGACGSCWAFSATEAVESAYALAGNDLVVMAPQEIVDCAYGLFTNHGCKGGWYYYAYDWLKKNQTMREADYPYYSGYSGREYNCAYNESKGVTNVSSYTHVSGNASSIKAALAKGPVNVALSAGNYVFMYYQGGIISEYSGCPTSADHAVVAVGYGEENGQEYYIVRNSWGSGWGEQGYVRISTGGGYYGVCGINTAVYQPYV